MITGTYNVPATLPSQPILQEIFLECDSSLAPVTINLFDIADVNRQWDLVIYVSDATNSASVNPITINCAAGNHFDQVGVSTISLTLDGSAFELRIASELTWLASEGTTGSSTPSIRNVTYAQLYNLIITKGLEEGRKYRLLNYTCVNFLNGYRTAVNNPLPTDPNFNPRELKYSTEPEKIILTAISNYQLDPIGVSETYDGDVVVYQAFTNKIGLPFEIQNGSILPDSTIVAGFDLQLDALTNQVFFNMPTGYLALYGHNFRVRANFNDGVNPPYTLDIQTKCFTPFFTNDVTTFGDVTSDIETPDQIKIILLGLTVTDFNNYVANSLFVDAIYALGDARGYMNRRENSNFSVSIPFDWRNYVYRRFEVDLTAINPYFPALATVPLYLGIGDNYLGQGTTGRFADYKVVPEGCVNIDWTGSSTIDALVVYNDGRQVQGAMDNSVFFGFFQANQINEGLFLENTFNDFLFTVVNTSFVSGNASWGSILTVTMNSFQGNIFQSVQSSVLNNIFSGNKFRDVNGVVCASNFNNVFRDINFAQIGTNFSQNNLIDIQFSTIGDFFLLNNFAASINNCQIGTAFTSNTITQPNLPVGFADNIIASNFQFNTIGVMIYCNFGKQVTSNQFTSVNFSRFGNFITNNTVSVEIDRCIIGDNFSFNVIGRMRSCTFDGNTRDNNFGLVFEFNTAGFEFLRNTFVGSSNAENNFGTKFRDNVTNGFFVRNNFNDNSTNNTFGVGFSRNRFYSSCFSNNLSGSDNDFFGNCLLNNVYCGGNSVKGAFQQNNFTGIFSGNTIEDSLSNNIGVDFHRNLITTSIVGIDFTLSTIASNLNYSKTIFQRSDAARRISYVDATDTIIYNLITA